MDCPAKDPWTMEKISEHLRHYLALGSLCSSTIVKIAEDIGIPKRAMQNAVQIGLERGTLKLDDGLHIAINNGVKTNAD